MLFSRRFIVINLAENWGFAYGGRQSSAGGEAKTPVGSGTAVTVSATRSGVTVLHYTAVFRRQKFSPLPLPTVVCHSIVYDVKLSVTHSDYGLTIITMK